jgi:hypothetical protein
MRRRMIFLGCTLLASLIFVNAQSPALDGTWILETAQINLLEKGLSEPVHQLTTAEINAKQIPSVLKFETNTVKATVRGLERQSNYKFEKAQFTFGQAGQEKTYMAWNENEKTLVLISEYDQSDFKGNELRITYKKQ